MIVNRQLLPVDGITHRIGTAAGLITVPAVRRRVEDGETHVALSGNRRAEGAMNEQFNPDQFEIIKFRKGNNGKDLSINGKCPYFRILIKNKRV